MLTKDVHRLIALCIFFLVVVLANAFFSNIVADHVSQAFEWLTDMSFSVRLITAKIISGIKFSFSGEISKPVYIDGNIFGKYSPVLGTRESYILAAGDTNKGSVALDPDAKSVVGIVEKNTAGVCWIRPIHDTSFVMRVFVEKDDLVVEGELFGGERLRIYETVDVTGGEVYVSDDFPYGTLIRNIGYGKVGKVVGVENSYYLLKGTFKIPSHVILLPNLPEN